MAAAAALKLSAVEGNNLLYAGSGRRFALGWFGRRHALWQFGGGHRCAWLWQRLERGNTSMYAGTGSDTLYGGLHARQSNGPRALTYGRRRRQQSLVSWRAITSYGGSGNDTMCGGGHALSAGSGNELMLRSPIAHIPAAWSALRVRSGGNDFYGVGSIRWARSGNDTVYGGTGADTVNTSTGNDTIFGGNSTTVNAANTQASIASQTVVGGVTQITFGNGQQLVCEERHHQLHRRRHDSYLSPIAAPREKKSRGAALDLLRRFSAE